MSNEMHDAFQTTKGIVMLPNNIKIAELGSIQSITHKVFNAFLLDKNIGVGPSEISSAVLFKLFLSYLAEQNYLFTPSSRAFGRAASKKLPWTKKATGTHYKVNFATL